jgi:hypothetical protein
LLLLLLLLPLWPPALESLATEPTCKGEDNGPRASSEALRNRLLPRADGPKGGLPAAMLPTPLVPEASAAPDADSLSDTTSANESARGRVDAVLGVKSGEGGFCFASMVLVFFSLRDTGADGRLTVVGVEGSVWELVGGVGTVWTAGMIRAGTKGVLVEAGVMELVIVDEFVTRTPATRAVRHSKTSATEALSVLRIFASNTAREIDKTDVASSTPKPCRFMKLNICERRMHRRVRKSLREEAQSTSGMRHKSASKYKKHFIRTSISDG